MTTTDEHEQRARAVVQAWEDACENGPLTEDGPEIATFIASALRAAVAAERERCKAIVEDHGGTYCMASCALCALAERISTPAPAQAEQRVSEASKARIVAKMLDLAAGWDASARISRRSAERANERQAARCDAEATAREGCARAVRLVLRSEADALERGEKP
jgi:hypothetical protein